ncbi:hypothetical protein DFH27DRAFT_266894 [Peziza echinospora]|nr:hypothetical protein DFH27DRAFT_266894 [Peziza echinospora]
MSSGGAQTQPPLREVVFCHQCHDEWLRSEHGLICPSCAGEFVEILENATSDPSISSGRSGLPFHQHDSSDEDDEPRLFDPSHILPAQLLRLNPLTGVFEPPPTVPPRSSAQDRPPAPANNTSSPLPNTGGAQPNIVEMLHSIFASIMGDQNIERAREDLAAREANERPAPPAGGDHVPPDPRIRARATGIVFTSGPDGNGRVLQELFGAPINEPGGGLIHHIMGLNPAGPPGGDYVWSQGQLDRVISQLMEQHQGNAPPPAPPEVLNNLPKIKVEQQRVLEGEDCAVCKEELVLDEEVAQLPCTHVYHEFCIKKWLEARDTCPICRAPTAPAREQQSQTTPQPSTPPATRRPWQIFGNLGRSSHTSTTTTPSNNNSTANNNNNNNNINSNNSNPGNTRPSWPGAWTPDNDNSR